MDKAGLVEDPRPGDDVGSRLFALVGEALAGGVDPAGWLRTTVRGYLAAVRAARGRPAAAAARTLMA